MSPIPQRHTLRNISFPKIHFIWHLLELRLVVKKCVISDLYKFKESADLTTVLTLVLDELHMLY